MTVSRSSDHVYRQLPARRTTDPLPGDTRSSSIRLVEVESADSRNAHRHPLSEEVIYVESGAGSIWIDGEFEPINSGDVILIPPGAGHATIPAPGSKMRLICFFPHGDLDQNIEETKTVISREGRAS